MLNRPKARTRGYSCPLDENVARSILHKTIAIESKMIHRSYRTTQNETHQRLGERSESEPNARKAQGSKSKANLNSALNRAQRSESEANPNRNNGSSPTASPQWFRERSESEPPARPHPPQRSKSKANLSKRPKGVNQGPGHAPVNQRAAPWRVQLT